MRKRLLLFGLVLLLTVPLTLVLWDFTRGAIVIPLLYVLWLGNLIFQSIPQSFLWALFFAIALIISLKSLAKSQRPMQTAYEAEPEHLGQVSLWAERIHTMTRGGYYEWLLAQYLGKLFLAVLAYRERLSPWQIRGHLKEGKLGAPPEITAYIEAGLGAMSPRPFSLLSRFTRRSRSRAQASPLDLDPERVVQFLEDQLEVGYDHRDRGSVRSD